MSLSLEQVGAVLLALVTAVVSMLLGGTADPLSNLVGSVTTPDAIARPFFSGKREPWHPLPPDEGDSGDGPPGTV